MPANFCKTCVGHPVQRRGWPWARTTWTCPDCVRNPGYMTPPAKPKAPPASPPPPKNPPVLTIKLIAFYAVVSLLPALSLATHTGYSESPATQPTTQPATQPADDNVMTPCETPEEHKRPAPPRGVIERDLERLFRGLECRDDRTPPGLM